MTSKPDSEASIRQHVITAAQRLLSGPLEESLLPRGEVDRREVLLRLADLEFKLRGSGKCEVCNAPVRAVMPTVAHDEQGNESHYDCLCRRCLEAEKAYSRRVTAYIAGVVFEDYINPRPLVARPGRKQKLVAA